MKINSKKQFGFKQDSSKKIGSPLFIFGAIFQH